MKTVKNKTMLARTLMTLLAVFMSVGTWAQSVTPNPGDTWDDATKTLTVNSNPGDNDYCMAPIEHLIISDGVTSIGGGAFSVCSDLVSVTIGKDLVSIGDYAFTQSGPTSIVFPDNVKTIGASAFVGGQLTSVTIGKGMTSIGHKAFSGCPVENFVVDNANENYKSVDGVLFTIDGKTLMCYPAAHARNKYAIPYGVTTIEENAFTNCNNLISVIIPNSVTSIEKESFYYCTNLATVTIGSGMTSIGDNTFCYCTATTDVYCYADPTQLTWTKANTIFKKAKATQCHVKNVSAWSGFSAVNVTFVEMSGGYDCAADNHMWSDWSNTQPTCTENGEQKRTCSLCGYTETISIPALGHDFTMTTVPPTCTEDGMQTTTCSRCGDTETISIPALGHDFTTTTVPPTCTEEGKIINTCNRCGHTETTSIPALGHDYTMTIVEPTCTEDGMQTTTCSRCGDSETMVIPALGHDLTITTVPPTCTEDGMQTTSCNRCSYTETTSIPALGHDFTMTIVEPTCTEDGMEITTCNRCGDSETKVIPALGHEWNASGVCLVCSETHSLTVYDDQDNTTDINLNDGQFICDFTISGRTLKANHWNTICLPFDLSAEQIANSPLKDAVIRTVSTLKNDGSTLKLTFSDADMIIAGMPYIVRFKGDNIVNPKFENVTIKKTTVPVVMAGNYFIGSYRSFVLNTNNTLFLQNDNFYYPTADVTVGAFRAYFSLAKAAPASASARIIVDFGDDNATEIKHVNVSDDENIWYTVNGIRLVGEPNAKGTYIVNGKKVFIK